MITPPRGWFRIASFALTIGLAGGLASAATFTVDSTGDESDADLADGICRTALGTCTLRAAIEQANGLAGPDTIANIHHPAQDVTGCASEDWGFGNGLNAAR